jgi:hypothetical protein
MKDNIQSVEFDDELADTNISKILNKNDKHKRIAKEISEIVRELKWLMK